jgi:hypothetical protein
MSDSAQTTPDAGATTSQFALSMRSQTDQAKQRLADYQSRWRSAQEKLESQIERLQKLNAQQIASAERIRELEAQLAEAEQAAAGDGETPSPGDGDEFRRRYEMSLDDLRELKAKNSDLEQEIAKLRKTGPGGAAARLPGRSLNWEAEKARVLALLEAESEPTAERREEQAKIEEVLQTTDRLLAEKDRQIEELNRQLEERPQVVDQAAQDQAAQDQAAVASALDLDAAIREERAKLERLQKEWRDKLSLAEVELSLERAKLARERAEIESKRQGQRTQAPAEAGASPAAKPPRGRWLARLGLANDENDPGETQSP